MTDGYKQIVHKELKVSATGGLIIEKTGTREETAENEKITITKEDVGFQNGKIRVTAKDGERWLSAASGEDMEILLMPEYWIFMQHQKE